MTLMPTEPFPRYRYVLDRAVEPASFLHEGTLVFLLLNPSVADQHRDDPTIRRCVSFTRRFGFARLEVVNLFAFRATEPAALLAAARAGVDVVGPGNDLVLPEVFARADALVVGWGGASAPRLRDLVVARLPAVSALLGSCPRVLLPQCLGVTSTGMPRHPVRLRADARCVRWSFPGGDVHSSRGPGVEPVTVTLPDDRPVTC